MREVWDIAPMCQCPLGIQTMRREGWISMYSNEFDCFAHAISIVPYLFNRMNCLPLSMLRSVGIMVEIHAISHCREVSHRKTFSDYQPDAEAA